jgi:hypothetical protein
VVYIATFPFKSKIVEPEETAVAMERLSKHASAATDRHAK